MKTLKHYTLEEIKEEWPPYEGINIKGQLQPGDKINNLTVVYKTKKNKIIYFVCKCDCGNYTAVAQAKIKSGHTKSCGCLVGEKAKETAIDLTGQKFGRLTVIERAGSSKDRFALWLCECSCYDKNGKHPRKIIRGDSLRNNSTKSCGCLNKERMIELGKNSLIDLTNKQFGHWTVLERADNKYNENGSRYTMWLCQCDCENKTKKIINGSSLISGGSTSCGCATKNFKGEEKISQILTDNNIIFEREKSFDTCKNKRKLRFDFYIPDKNYLIEYDGILHYKATGGKFGTLENVESNQKRDEIKNQWCKENNMSLIRIPYTHLDKICLEDLLLETTTFLI